MSTLSRHKISGKDGSVTVDATSFCVKSWRLTLSVDTVDVTDTCSQGYVEYVTTFKKGEGSFEAFLDLLNIPEIQVGDQATFLLETTTATGGLNYSFSGFFTSFETSVDVGGAVTFNGNFVTTGVVTQGVNA